MFVKKIIYISWDCPVNRVENCNKHRLILNPKTRGSYWDQEVSIFVKIFKFYLVTQSQAHGKIESFWIWNIRPSVSFAL